MKMNTENRCDRKWAHPDVLGGSNWEVPHLMDLFYKYQDMSAEEFEEARKYEREALLGASLVSESEKRKAQGDWRFETVSGCAEEPDQPVDICIRVPKNPEKKLLPCIFEIPGGGMYSAGSYEYNMSSLYTLSKHHNAVVVSMCYRLVREAKYPAALNDCHAAYQWLLEHCEELSVDREKIVIHGFSSGGQLALAMGFRLKRYGIRPRGIIATVPGISDVNLNHSGKISFRNKEHNDDIEAWDAEGVHIVMREWLGDLFGSAALSPEAMPGRATVEDLRDYPPVWIPAVGEMDPSRDAVVEFCSKIYEAGGFCDYHVWGGCNHNTTDPATVIGKKISDEDEWCISNALKYDFSRSWRREK